MSRIAWNEFKRNFPPNRKLHIMPGKYTNGKNLEAILHIMAQIKLNRVLELYTAYGHTTLTMARNFPEATIVTADIGVVIKTTKQQQGEILPANLVGSAFHHAPEAKRIKQILINPNKLLSHKTFLKFRLYDVVFIDGLHTLDGVLRDTRIAIQAVHDNSILIWGDYWDACPGVVAFIDNLNKAMGGMVTHVDSTRICYCHLNNRKRTLIRAFVDSFHA
jgi:hypothetical protein